VSVAPAPAGSLLNLRIAGLACGAILVPLNSTMLAVALPSIMGDFDVDARTVATLVTIYLGSVVVALPVSGALGDRFGHRRTFLVGVVGFALASILAVVTSAFALLVASRVLQAASGSLVSTSSVSLVRAAARPEARGAAFGFFDMLVSISAAVGPFLGGILVGAFGWHAIFLIAVPVSAVAALVIALSSLTDAPAAQPRPVDVPGLLLVAIFLGGLLTALLAFGQPAGIAAAVLTPVLFVAFIGYELRSPHPAVDPRLFARPAYAAAVAGVLGATVVLHASFILVPLLTERVLLGSAATAGVVLLALSALSAVSAPLGGRASDRLGRRAPAVAGGVIMTLGLGAMWLFIPGATLLGVGAMLGLVGIGFGLAGSPRQAAALEAVDAGEVGMAAGTYFTGRYFGGVLGSSLAGVVVGEQVTGAGVSLGFGVLTFVGLAIAIVSVWLPARHAVAVASVEHA
jgi:EmrB/QacA subfamily drug resistance transporter